MKVLHVIPSLAIRTGGPAVCVVEASTALEKVGVEATIVTTDIETVRRRGKSSQANLLPGAAQLDVRMHEVRHLHRLAYSADLSKTLREITPQYDVVHIHSLFLHPQYAGYTVADRAGVPYVVSPHGALDPWLRRRGRIRKAAVDALWQRKMLSRASTLHVTSELEAGFIADISPSVRRKIVPIGIQWERFQGLPSGQAFRERFFEGFDGPLALSHGRLTRKKGLDLLIRAIALLPPDLSECRLALVGPDDERMTPELMEVAAEVGVADRVKLCGLLTGNDLLGALAAADVWALPSHTENFAIAIVEALASGLPVVVSPVAGVGREAGERGAARHCRLDPNSIAEEMSSLLLDFGEARALGERARTYSKEFAWERVVAGFAEMYRETLGA